MTLSVPAQHLFMLGLGWTHGDLNAMNEEEFAWWYEEAVALEEAKAEAIRNAQNK